MKVEWARWVGWAHNIDQRRETARCVRTLNIPNTHLYYTYYSYYTLYEPYILITAQNTLYSQHIYTLHFYTSL